MWRSERGAPHRCALATFGSSCTFGRTTRPHWLPVAEARTACAISSSALLPSQETTQGRGRPTRQAQSTDKALRKTPSPCCHHHHFLLGSLVLFSVTFSLFFFSNYYSSSTFFFWEIPRWTCLRVTRRTRIQMMIPPRIRHKQRSVQPRHPKAKARTRPQPKTRERPRKQRLEK